MKTATIFDETFQTRVLLIWNVTHAELTCLIRRRFDADYDGDADFAGRCLNYRDAEGGQTVVIALHKWSRDADGISLLTHELFHCTEHVMSYHDIALSPETSEVFAYFLDSLVRRSLNILP